VTVAAASSSVVKKIKSVVYLHMFTNISQQAVQHDFIRCTSAHAASASAVLQQQSLLHSSPSLIF